MSLTFVCIVIGLISLYGQSTMISFEDASVWASGGSLPENTIVLENDNEDYVEGSASMSVMVEYHTFYVWGGWTDISFTLDEAYDASTYDELHFKLKIIKEPTQNHRSLQFTCDLFEDDGAGEAGEMWRYPEDLDIFYTPHSITTDDSIASSWFDVTIPFRNLVQPAWYSPTDGWMDFSAIRKFAFGVHTDNDSVSYSTGGEVSDTVKFLIDDLYFARSRDHGQLLSMEENVADWSVKTGDPANIVTLENSSEYYAEGAGSVKGNITMDESSFYVSGMWSDMSYTFDTPIAVGNATSLRLGFKVTSVPIRKNLLFTFDVKDMNSDGSVQLFRWGGDNERPGHYGLLNHIDSDYPKGYHGRTTGAMYREIVIPFADMFTPDSSSSPDHDNVITNIHTIAMGINARREAKLDSIGDAISAAVSDEATWFMDDLRLASSKRDPYWLAIDDEALVAHTFSLFQNYPNPFNPTTTIEYSLGARRDVNLFISSINGELVKTLETGNRSAGAHKVVWNGLDSRNNPVASGIYIYTLEADGSQYSKRLVLLR